MVTRSQHQWVPTAEELSTMPWWRRRAFPVWGTPRRRLGAVLVMVGGAAIAIASFLPWLGNGHDLTGWDVYTRRSAAGANPFLFRPDDWTDVSSYFFTGLTTMVVGVLLVVTAAVLLIAQGKPPPSTSIVWLALTLPAGLVVVAGLLVPLVNLLSAAVGPGYALVSVQYGLWVALAGAGVVIIGWVLESSGKSRRAQKRWEQEILAGAPGSTVE